MFELHVDNETYDTLPTAVVLTVGAVFFDGDHIAHRIYFAPSVEEQIKRGRTISASTLEWWMSQSQEAREPLYQAPKLTIDEGRQVLRNFGAQAQRVWARPGMFDLPMLRSLFGQDLWDNEGEQRFGRGYQKEADMQGLVLEVDPQRELAPTFEGIAHHALHDAEHHHKWLQNIRKRMASWKDAYTATMPWQDLPEITP